MSPDTDSSDTDSRDAALPDAGGRVRHNRDTDRQQLPERMRRDVRLLGDMLGEVHQRVRRRRTCSRTWKGCGRRSSTPARGARPLRRRTARPAGDAIAALVGQLVAGSRGAVARAFTVYFHLANLAEEQQRVRDAAGTGLRPDRPPRESLADAVARDHRRAGPGQLDDLLAGLRVHPVFTAHPTEARRRAVVPSLRRISELLTALDDDRRGAARAGGDAAAAARGDRPALADRAAAGRRDDPARRGPHGDDRVRRDAVPAGARRVPGAGPGAARPAERRGARSPVPAVPAVRQLGGRRPGRQPDGDRARSPGRPRSSRPITRCARWRPRPARIGRALTVNARLRAAVGRAAPRRWRPRRPRTRSCWPRSPPARRSEPYRTYLLYAGRAAGRRRGSRDADLAYGGAAEFLADLRLVQQSLAAGGRDPAGLRRAAAPDLAGRDVRVPPGRARGPAALRGARPRAGGAARRAATPVRR